MRSIVPCLVLVAAALSAAAVDAAVPDGRSAAAQSLLETAQLSLSAGEPERAAILIERALRIDPSNPTLWHYLGLARRELGDTVQADAMAAKSRALAGAPPELRARNGAATNKVTPALGTRLPRAIDSARTWVSRGWSGSRRDASGSSRSTAPDRRNFSARDGARNENAASDDNCEVWFFDERGRRQQWIMKCDDARRYAARGGSAVMIRTGTPNDRRSRPSSEAQQ